MATKKKGMRRSAGFIDVSYLKKQWELLRYNDSAGTALGVLREEISAALSMLGHAKDTASHLRDIVEDDDDAPDELREFVMYLEDDIDNIENGDLYDLYLEVSRESGQANR